MKRQQQQKQQQYFVKFCVAFYLLFFRLSRGKSTENKCYVGQSLGLPGRQSCKNMRHMQIMPRTAPFVGENSVAPIAMFVFSFYDA